MDIVNIRPVLPQKTIADRAERRTNRANSMNCTADLSGQAVIVLDDLYMEGDTMDEAVRALRAAGASCVMAVVAVKTPTGTRGGAGNLVKKKT